MKLLLIRHGETIWNTEHRTQGHTDVPLNDNGRKQAAALSERLKNVPLTGIFSSPLSRAFDTACALAAPHGLAPIATNLLLERNFGSWEGLPFSEIQAEFPEQAQCWEQDPFAYTPPGAEPLCDVLARCQKLLNDIFLEYSNAGGYIVLVSHSVPLRLILADSIGLPPQHLHTLWIDNASCTELRISARGRRLYTLNDTSHLIKDEL